MTLNEELFSVTQFFMDGSYETVIKHVPMQEAVDKAVWYCRSVTAIIGVTQRVIITDSGDCIVFEWQFTRGVVFPKQEDMKQ